MVLDRAKVEIVTAEGLERELNLVRALCSEYACPGFLVPHGQSGALTARP
jgi:hypothetical protein